MAEIIGLKATIETLNKLPKTYAKERKKALRKAAKPLTSAIKKNLTRVYSTEDRDKARRTGNLRKSIKILSHIKNKAVTYVGPNYKIGKGTRGPHAHLLEYGTAKSDARPFMKPAYNSTKTQVANILEEQTKMILKGYKAKYER
jgi:HK97 gp10 family phage protein